MTEERSLPAALFAEPQLVPGDNQLWPAAHCYVLQESQHYAGPTPKICVPAVFFGSDVTVDMRTTSYEALFPK